MSVEAHHLVHQYRNQLEQYIAKNPHFIKSLEPLPTDVLAPAIIKEMQKAAMATGVGPMAAVAGAIAEFVGRELLKNGIEEIAIENGGDVFIMRKSDCRVSIFSGRSPLSNRIGIKISCASMPLGVCTSSGTVGHSFSFGNADSVTVVSQSTCLADAAATSICNKISRPSDIGSALDYAKKIKGLRGVVIVSGEHLGAWGSLELIQL